MSDSTVGRFMRPFATCAFPITQPVLFPTIRDVLARRVGVGTYVPVCEVYVKLAAFFSSGCVQAVCVSFHEAEHRLSYPFRREGPELV